MLKPPKSPSPKSSRHRFFRFGRSKSPKPAMEEESREQPRSMPSPMPSPAYEPDSRGRTPEKTPEPEDEAAKKRKLDYEALL